MPTASRSCRSRNPSTRAPAWGGSQMPLRLEAAILSRTIRALAADLDHRGIRSKPRRLSTGRSIGGGAFGVGALAYLLKNRFYIGEVVYRGQINRGDHTPILGPDLFEPVQRTLAAQAVERRCRLRGSPAALSGRLFDDRGNRMSPSHTNKAGARYRYYVSQAVLQRKPLAAGAIARVPAAEIEMLISAAVRSHLHRPKRTRAQAVPAPSSWMVLSLLMDVSFK